MNEVLIIIPAYNEEETIHYVVNNIIENYKEYDYVIVNDGSKDNTLKKCKEYGYNVIDLPVNVGLAGGFKAGMKYAYRNGYEYAIQMDADGQHKPEYIVKLLESAKTRADIVIGSRFAEKKKPINARMIGSRLITLAIRLTTGKKINDPTSGMRMYNRHMIRECALNMNYGPEPDTISFLIKNGIEVEEVQVEMCDRIAGESYLTTFKSISYMVRMLISILVIQNFRIRKQ